jgi:CubicO group peptidase (beta-lactamase class C family)
MSQPDADLLKDGVAYADQWMAYQQERRDVPGIVVAIRWHDQILLSKGYGYADLERQVPMTPRHIFRIASHSKTFTATAIMQLVEQGKLRLDDRLATYVPWLAGPQELGQVTVRQALNHTSGIVRDGHDADYWQLEHAFPDDNSLRVMTEDGGSVLPANETFKYSNIAYALLGLVIERAGGMSYHEHMKRHIIDPLGLLDTGPETDFHARSRLATGYTTRRFLAPRRPIPDISTRAMAPATGFYSTAEDLCRYAAAHCMGNDELLSDASKRQMQQPYWTVEQADAHYGLGFDVIDVGERRMIGHGGGFPGHTTRTMFDPRDRLVVVVLTNEIGGPALPLARTVVQILDYALAQPRTPHDGSPGPYDRFVGRFANLGSVTDVAAFGDTLVALSPDEDDPLKSVTKLAVEDPDTLRITATNGFGAQGETIRYTRDAAGRVIKVVEGGVTAYPLDIYRAEYASKAFAGPATLP